MRVYLDLCCLKRPFDRQDQPRVRLESEAVLAILSVRQARLTLLRTPAHLLENSLNPVQSRREAVDDWLLAGSIEDVPAPTLSRRTEELIRGGFGAFDALHLAYAEAARCDVFATCDQPLLRKASQPRTKLPFRVADPIALAREVSGWPD